MNLDVDEALTSDSLSKQTIVLTVQFGSDRQRILKYEMMTKISFQDNYFAFIHFDFIEYTMWTV